MSGGKWLVPTKNNHGRKLVNTVGILNPISKMHKKEKWQEIRKHSKNIKSHLENKSRMVNQYLRRLFFSLAVYKQFLYQITTQNEGKAQTFSFRIEGEGEI